ncbi:hypothetical protein BJ684DRAFT_16114 [Piptocephalis cylindrospora]|uniref:Uncharacterized protein n=1 Tax=Piptocephalis cylindrospora TaxID=1907219 RepID=A0A4P9Y3J5_9FUNG|nr:hypothetical protein BJ684DRAFT_16114 [Piptocephalis cylindrospora]|eukprot:RKP13486.1 hypothetical protein BJ684DRAFT_16114 [Piptocephalis cylindrospora]
MAVKVAEVEFLNSVRECERGEGGTRCLPWIRVGEARGQWKDVSEQRCGKNGKAVNEGEAGAGKRERHFQGRTKLEGGERDPTRLNFSYCGEIKSGSTDGTVGKDEGRGLWWKEKKGGEKSPPRVYRSAHHSHLAFGLMRQYILRGVAFAVVAVAREMKQSFRHPNYVQDAL